MGNVFIYLILFIEAFCIEEKFIKYPFKTNFGGYYMELFIGNPTQKIYHGIDQGLTVTWTDYSMYSPDKSSTKHIIKDDTQLKFQNMRLYGKEITDDIIFLNDNKKDIIMNSFPFFLISNSRGYNSRVGGIGLAYKFTDTKYSLVHQLKQHNLISSLSFSLIPPNQNENNGTIYFGPIPLELTYNKKLSSCSIVGRYANWACDLSYIFFGEISYVYDNVYFNNKDYAYFQSAEKRILAPGKFMKYLNSTVFKEHIQNKKCFYEMYGMNFQFQCNCDIGYSLPDFNFVFDSISYTFTAKDLFEINHGDVCNFLIVSNHIRDNNWIFGTSFLKHYITKFDYEDKSVNFYYSSDKKVEAVDLDAIFPWKRILRYIGYFALVLVSLSIVVYVIMRLKAKKKRKMKRLIEQVGQQL